MRFSAAPSRSGHIRQKARLRPWTSRARRQARPRHRGAQTALSRPIIRKRGLLAGLLCGAEARGGASAVKHIGPRSPGGYVSRVSLRPCRRPDRHRAAEGRPLVLRVPISRSCQSSQEPCASCFQRLTLVLDLARKRSGWERYQKAAGILSRTGCTDLRHTTPPAHAGGLKPAVCSSVRAT